MKGFNRNKKRGEHFAMYRKNVKIIEDLKGIINDYIAAHPSRNISKLSYITGIPQATIWRYLRGEIESPSLETVMIILNKILTPTELLAFLRKHCTAVGKFFNRAKQKKLDLVNLLNRGMGKAESFYYIYQLASTPHGITPEYVKKIRGSYGLLALSALLDGEVLAQKGNRIYSELQKNRIW